MPMISLYLLGLINGIFAFEVSVSGISDIKRALDGDAMRFNK